MMNLGHLTALELGRLVNSKVISTAEVLNYFRDKIICRNGELNAFVYTKFDDAMAEADKLQQRILQGEYVGPFAGVPVGLKDFLPSKKGWTNSHGGVKSLVAVDDVDSEFYKAAKHAGAIAIGKTNAPSFGFSGCTDNKMYGPTANPFNIEYNSGGSSGGSASAVAGGLALMCEGGDAGGSIRIPASWCNLFGFKASKGTIPSYCRPDGWAATHPYCCTGALTKSVEDSATILNYMAKYDPRDPNSLPINAHTDFTQHIHRGVRGLHVAVTYDFDLFPTDPRIRSKIDEVCKILEGAGATIDYVHFRFKHLLEEFMRVWLASISVDTSLDLYQWKSEGLDLINDHMDELPVEWVVWNEKAFQASVLDFRYFNEIRTDILDAFENVYEDYDIIISPVTACMPVKNTPGKETIGPSSINGTKLLDSRIGFGETFLVNFVGYPAASVPAGLIDGLPVGVQVIGKQYADTDVFAVAGTLEDLNPWKNFYSISL